MNLNEPSNLLSKIVAEVLLRRQAGESLSDEAVLAEHADLAEPLKMELLRLLKTDSAQEPLITEQHDSNRSKGYCETVDHTPVIGTRKSEAGFVEGAHSSLSGDQARFRKLRPFAAGGVGEVWLALDMQIQREVALKELQEQHSEDEIKRDRFLIEGHITGVLEHPGIVPVYAIGMDERQHPYYAMRLVRGESLTQAINEFHASALASSSFSRNDLAFGSLLRRFADVSLTVAYAHSRGVLHRDLKPDNIMLGKYGESYIVDWGLARILGSKAENDSLVSEEIVRPAQRHSDSATRQGSLMGTPGFMSPEQAEGRIDELGPATDIYSLGAILYYLLTNRPPIKAESTIEFLQKVKIGDLQPPESINPQAPRSLCQIAMLAMEVKPQNRYGSARELTGEIERWLADEPVVAAPESLSEKFGRYVRRNYRWLAPLGTAAILIAITTSIAAISINRSRERAEAAAVAEQQAKERAEANFLKARETVDTWLTGYNQALQNIPVAGVQAVRARMLELAATEYENFVAERVDDPSLQIEQGRTLIRLGSIYRTLGRLEESAENYQAGITALERIGQISSNDVPTSSTLAQAHGMLALLYADLGNLAQAEQEFEAGLASLSEEGSLDSANLSALTTLWTNWGGVLAKAGNYKDADSAFQKALNSGGSLVSLTKGDLPSRQTIATAQIGAGQVKLVEGDAKAACQIFEQAARFFDAAQMIDDQSVRNLQLAIAANSHLATAKRRLGDAHGEQGAYLAAVGFAERLVKLQPEVPSFRANLAMMQTDYGQALVEQFNPTAAGPYLENAAQTLSALATEFPKIPEYREALVVALVNLAQAEQGLGHFENSLMCLGKADAELDGLLIAFPEVLPYRERAVVLESIAAQVLYLADRKTEAVARFANSAKHFEELALIEPDAVDNNHAAAVMYLRYGQALQQEDPTAATEKVLRSQHLWEAVLEESTDPQLMSGAAWFYTVCVDSNLRDPDKALPLTDPPSAEVSSNFRFRLTRALAQAMAGNWKQCEATLNANPKPEAETEQILKYLQALVLRSAGKSQAADECWQEADAWTMKHLPGQWDLLTLKQVSSGMLAEPLMKSASPKD